MTEFLTT